MASEKSLAAEIEAALTARVKVIRIRGQRVRFIEDIPALAAEIAALQGRAFEDGARGSVRWEPKGQGCEMAYSGDLMVGMVVERDDGAGGREWAYSVDAVHTKRITKGHGGTKSLRAAKAAVERAWTAWLVHAGRAALAPNTTEGRTDRG
ncbi:hypothetical protein ACSD7O_19600 [Methylorubrum extorquens]|uniref:hypothetical protein n=1 Tax=Methylorubrum extorquens TaxID=408 RepID=UPI003F5D897C